MSTIIVGDLNSLKNGHKISKDIVELNTIIYQLDIIDIWKLHPVTAENTFFISSHGTFTKIDHRLDHITHPNKLKRTTSG